MRLIDYLPTRVVELTVHSLDLTDAIGRPATVRSTAVELDDGPHASTSPIRSC